jgi:hypothetical protein
LLRTISGIAAMSENAQRCDAIQFSGSATRHSHGLLVMNAPGARRTSILQHPWAYGYDSECWPIGNARWNSITVSDRRTSL